METGTETIGPDELQQLADAAFAGADAAVPADGPVETPGNPAGGPGGEPIDNTVFCREIIASICRHHSEAVRKEFTSKIEPIAGATVAARIADRAAMSPALQDQVADNGAKVLDKYGLARFINAEAALGAALVAHFFNLSAARADLNALLNAAQPAQ